MGAILFSIIWMAMVSYVDKKVCENFAPITMGTEITIIFIETVCFILGFLLILLVSEREESQKERFETIVCRL